MFAWQLSQPAQLTTNVQPAVLPDPSSPPLSSDTCTVSGWGVTQIYSSYLSPVLRAVDVQVISNCRRYYYWGMVTANMLCAGSRLGGKDSCQVQMFANRRSVNASLMCEEQGSCCDLSHHHRETLGGRWSAAAASRASCHGGSDVRTRTSLESTPKSGTTSAGSTRSSKATQKNDPPTQLLWADVRLSPENI